MLDAEKIFLDYASGYDRDYYTDEEYHWESKPGLKRKCCVIYEIEGF